MDNELMVKTEEGGILERNNYKKFTTLDLTDKSNQVKLYNSLQQCDIRINDIKGQVIEIADLFIESKVIADRDENDKIIYNEETGEVKTKTHFRTILYDVEGKTYVSASYGVYNSLRTIVSIFGNPSSDNVIKVKVETKPARIKDHENLILTVVE